MLHTSLRAASTLPSPRCGSRRSLRCPGSRGDPHRPQRAREGAGFRQAGLVSDSRLPLPAPLQCTIPRPPHSSPSCRPPSALPFLHGLLVTKEGCSDATFPIPSKSTSNSHLPGTGSVENQHRLLGDPLPACLRAPCYSHSAEVGARPAEVAEMKL